MLKYIFLLSQLLVLSSLLFGQVNKSIHQIENEKYKSQYSLEKNSAQPDASIMPLVKKVNNKLNKTVFGYLPYWEYSDNAQNNFRYDLLSHIAVFDFKVNQSGGFSKPSGWPWTSLINTAHQNGVKIIMTVTNFEVTKPQMHEILTNALLKSTFIANVKSTINTAMLDGINIDFEGGHIDTEDRGSVMNSFMTELTDSVHSWDSELEVSFASPAVNWGGWELTGLANSCDYLFVMGYDFYGGWSSKTGPSAPLKSSTSYNVTTTIDVQYQTTRIFNPEKLILGVPYFGPHFTASNSSEGAEVLSYVGATRFRDAQSEFNSFGVNWSNTFDNSWYNFLSGSTNHQVWIDNDSSLSLKYDLAISRNLKGVGMWALGYDGTRDELWNLLEEKFTDVVNVEQNNELPNNFYLSQNYPNPFNPVTNISYTVPSFNGRNGAFVSLKIYNHLGSEVKSLVNIFQSSGNYNIKFNAEKLSSGVYFYTLQMGNLSLTKKMILLK